jgi:hypothetical protein
MCKDDNVQRSHESYQTGTSRYMALKSKNDATFQTDLPHLQAAFKDYISLPQALNQDASCTVKNSHSFATFHGDCGTPHQDITLNAVDFPSNMHVWKLDAFSTEAQFRICECSASRYQLLQAGWMVSSLGSRSRYVVSLRLLEVYQRLLMRSHMSVHSFLSMINNSFARDDKVVGPFTQAFQFFRSLRQIKREDTFTRCPICPEGGHIHLALDACFRLKRRIKPGTSTSFLKSSLYSDPASIKAYAELNENEKRRDDNCRDFRAEANANKTKWDRTYDEKGVIGLFCARHGFILGLGDVFHGERYAYADYLLEQYLKNNDITPAPAQKIFLYYDINCLYKKHLERHPVLGKHMESIVFLVPKFHVYAHTQDCIRHLHPTMVAGTGMCDGECSERCWSYLGRFSNITKEMASGTRADTLKDAIEFYNMRLFDGAAKSLVKKVLTIDSKIAQAQEELDQMKTKLNTTNEDEIRALYVEEQMRPVTREPIIRDAQSQEAFRLDAWIFSLAQEVRHLEGERWLPVGYQESVAYSESVSSTYRKLRDRINERNSRGTPLAQVLTLQDALNFSSWYYHGKVDQRRAIDALCFRDRMKEERQLLHSDVLSFKEHLSKRVHTYLTLLSNDSHPGDKVLFKERLDFVRSHLQFVVGHLQHSQRGFETELLLKALSVCNGTEQEDEGCSIHSGVSDDYRSDCSQ